MQSAFNKTLDAINRGHTAEEFFDCIERAKKRNLNIATHLIFGLPGETKDQMLDTVRQVADIGLQGIKIHQLCIYRGTLNGTRLFFKATCLLMEEDEYIALMAEVPGRAITTRYGDYALARRRPQRRNHRS